MNFATCHFCVDYRGKPTLLTEPQDRPGVCKVCHDKHVALNEMLKTIARTVVTVPAQGFDGVDTFMDSHSGTGT